MRTIKFTLAAGMLILASAAPVHAANPVSGKAIYENTNGSPLSCSNAGCHGSSPSTGTNGIRAGANAPNVILSAISNNKGGMGFLGNAPYTVTALQAADIAAYIANPAAGTPSPAATLSTATLSFGSQVVQTSSGTMSASLTNTGSANLVLSTITLGGVNPAEFTRTGTCAQAVSLAPAASCSVDVVFKPTATGTRSATITIGHNATPNTNVLSLTGTGAAAPAPAVGLSATTLAFGDQTLGVASTPKSVSISNTGTANLVLGAITTTGTNAVDFASSNCSNTTLAPGNNCSISVTFRPASLNARTATLSVASNASGSPHGLALSGNGVAAPTPAVTLSPASLAFGNQTVGTSSAVRSITLTNSGNAALGVNSIVATGAGFASSHNCAPSLAAAASCRIDVTYSPTSAVAATGVVTITSTATGSPHIVGLSGTGTAPTPTAPVATLSPIAVDFGTVTLNTPSPMRAVSLTNTGNAPLNLSAVNVLGANSSDFSQTNNCPVGASLAAGASCTINAKFTPTAAGARAATLTLTSNAAGSASIELKGTGIVRTEAVAQVTPTQVQFAKQRLGKKSDERKVLVRNSGSTPLLIGSITVSGDFDLEHECKATLPVGKTCELKLKFKPIAVGTRLGELAVASNAAGAPHIVKLSGVGVNRSSREDDDECEDEERCNESTIPFARSRKH